MTRTTVVGWTTDNRCFLSLSFRKDVTENGGEINNKYLSELGKCDIILRKWDGIREIKISHVFR